MANLIMCSTLRNIVLIINKRSFTLIEVASFNDFEIFYSLIFLKTSARIFRTNSALRNHKKNGIPNFCRGS